ncbi:MAG: hypothetical protein JWM71_1032 [Solirubrobacteraceae bacterium]|nr:hypothetical protein [Solirubrobacteraceae bacterium]
MRDTIRKTAIAVAGLSALGGGFAVSADAATHHKHAPKQHARKHQAAATSTALTGDTKTSAEAAALAAVPGGTVTRSTAADADDAPAVYSVYVKKADGTRAEVLEDASFAVLSVTAEQGGCSGHGGPGGPGGNPNETPLTGDTKTSAESAALAAVPGGTVTRSSTEDPGDASGAAYEVHVTKADDSRVEVLEDASFTVLSVNADDHAGPGAGDQQRRGPRG